MRAFHATRVTLLLHLPHYCTSADVALCEAAAWGTHSPQIPSDPLTSQFKIKLPRVRNLHGDDHQLFPFFGQMIRQTFCDAPLNRSGGQRNLPIRFRFFQRRFFPGMHLAPYFIAIDGNVPRCLNCQPYTAARPFHYFDFYGTVDDDALTFTSA